VFFLAMAAPLPARGEADTKAIVALINQWGRAVAICRKGTPQAQQTVDACDRVHRMLIELDDLGWCYGRESDPGGSFFHRWHRCDSDSLHPMRP
jgi:hypothetical protein